MAEKYIKASECEKYFYEHLDDNGMIGAMNAIDEMPSADVQPVKRGHWVRVIGDDYECSECKAALWSREVYPVEKYKFCWSCGARMDLPEATKG